MIFAFGDCELDEDRRELRRGGRRVEIQPKALALLLHLVRHAGRTIATRELRESVWPDVAVTNNSLARAVRLARAAIGDRDVATSAIRTVSRIGYRFELPVQTLPRDHRGEEPTQRYVGRVRLRARLLEELDAALAGHGRILLLAGEAGIGKTRTADLLLAHARQAGARVAATRDVASAPNYFGWRQIVRTLAADAPAIVAALSPGERAALASVLADASDPAHEDRGGGEAARVERFEASHAFLARLAQERPLAVLLDDLHRADTETLSILEYLAGSISEVALGIVLTCREAEVTRTPQRSRVWERLLRGPAVDRTPLEGLAFEEIRELATQRMGTEPPAGLVEGLARQTGGNPLLIGESLRSLEARGLLDASRGADAWEALLPSGIAHLLDPKLRMLGAGAREVVIFAAVCGLEIERALLERIVDEPAALADQLREAEAVGLLHESVDGARVRFAHPLIREAAYAQLVPPGDGRRARHARVAAALEEREHASPDALAARAHHACEAVPLVPAETAIALAERAASQASRLHDVERCAAWCQRALAVAESADADDVATRARLLLALGTAQTRASGADSARTSFLRAADAARAMDRGDLFAAAALGVAHRPIGRGAVDPEVLRLLEEALRRAPPAELALAARVRSRLAAEVRYADAKRADALIAKALDDARAAGDPVALANVLDDATFLRWSPDDPSAWLALNAAATRAAHAANDLELALSGQKGCVAARLELADVAGLEREVRACGEIADRLRTPYARWLAAALRAMQALIVGDLAAAERHVSASLEPGERADSPDVALELPTQVVYLRLEQGRAGEMVAAARATAARFPDQPVWRAALARLLLAEGHAEDARATLEPLAATAFADLPRDRGWLLTLSLAAEVSWAIGDAELARVLADRMRPYTAITVVGGSGLLHYGSVAHFVGLLEAASGRLDDAIARFDEAIALEQRLGAHLWEARVRLARAASLAAAGDRVRAEEELRDVVATADARGWVQLGSEARAR